MNFSLKQWIVIVVLVSFIAFGAGMIAGKGAAKVQSSNSTPVVTTKETVEIKDDTPKDVTVYVAGAVKKSDVYKLPVGSIVKDAIEKAGGATKDADLVAINLAQKVQDGEEIVVPTKQSNIAPSSTSSSKNNGKININTASLTELETLPGIGEVKGNAIIQYRKTHGAFKSTHDITNVSGIGEKTFEKIEALITV